MEQPNPNQETEVLTRQDAPAAEPPIQPEPPAQPSYDQPEIDEEEEDDAPTEWVPTRFEKKVKAIPDRTWDMYQYLGGGAIGLITAAALFLSGTSNNIPLIVAVALAFILPRWLEDRGRRSLYKGRITMIIVLAVAIAAMVIRSVATHGFSFFEKKEEAETALGLLRAFRL